MMHRLSLMAAALILAAGLAAPAARAQDGGAAGDLTLAEFLAAVGGSETLQLEFDGEDAVFTRTAASWWAYLFLPEQLGAPEGERSVSVTVTVEEDGGGWPERLVGAGFAYGYHASDAPFIAVILSPQNGGVVQVAESLGGGQGVTVSQTLGSDSTAIGRPVRLTLAETTGGGIEVRIGDSRITLRNAVTSNRGRIGLILYGNGAYRFSDLAVGAQ